MHCGRFQPAALTRRDLLARSANGFGLAALAGLCHAWGLESEAARAANAPRGAGPLAPKAPHFPAKAKSVIFLFMDGGVSQVDSFDPKPRLAADHGKELKLDHPETRNRPGYERLFLKKPVWDFRARSSCGTEVSDIFPNVGQCMDDIALIRSMHGDHSNHYNATLGMHTGSFNIARPSIG